MSQKLVLIDGHSILNRAFYGVPDLSNAEGLHTNAIYGFLNIMFKILEEEKPDYLAVAFDVHAPTFRHQMYQAYKGTRKPMPEELRQQVPVMKEVLKAMHITIMEQAGLEADDILGTLAKKAIEADDAIDHQEREIENLCLKLFLTQQPVAGDMRNISAALKMITDMERIGDHASDISELTLCMAGTPYIKKLEHIQQMAKETIVMLVSSIEAYVNADEKKAKSVIEHDDVVDDLFDKVKNELITMIHENSDDGEQACDLLMVAKYLERIGDHATNISEWVLFSITGEHID